MYPPGIGIDDDSSSWAFPTFNESVLPGMPWEAFDNTIRSEGDSHSSDELVIVETGSSSESPQKVSPKQFKQRTLTPNLTRRSHKKSRAGCHTCKGRKIKCGEEKPSCRHCVQKELECRYPDQNQVVCRNINKKAQSPLPSLSPTAGIFKLADFRFFQHFLKFAYPSLPAGNDRVWVSSVPQLALESEYLMHATLSLGASHLHRLMPENGYETQAIMHRGHAISGLNQAIAKRQITRADADSMLAACYALTFQASYMEDGLQDFITMVRGCAIVTGKISEESSGTTFDLSPTLHLDTLEPGLSQMELLDADFLDSGVIALEALESMVIGDSESRFYKTMVDVLYALRKSTRQGFLVFSECYSCWYLLQGEKFRAFTDPKNTIAQVLLAYFVGIQLMLAPVTAPLYTSPLREGAAGVEMLMGIVAWGEKIFPLIPDEFQVHLAWPKMVTATVRLEISNPKIEKKLLKLRKD